ncbi:MAG: fumarate hydratase [Desulfobulbaceae bacterium]|nr:fumarate hydratase [Desulfobulbaceae bacterium]
MRTINGEQITQAVTQLAITAAHDLEPDILDSILAARDRETSELAKSVLDLLITNADIASRELIPACQDTGICTIFITIGQDVFIEGDLHEAVQKGIAVGYQDGYLRKSVCDVLTRKNTGNNVPAVVHIDMVPGDKLHIRFLPKGCGSENMSGLKMLPPSAGIKGAVDFIVNTVVKAGPNPCPPLVVGVGLGGTFEKAALMAKHVLFRPVGTPSDIEEVAQLEAEILKKVNQEGVGVHGLGGCNTALAVHIETYPTHIASLPVAVNIQCHSHRHKELIL